MRPKYIIPASLVLQLVFAALVVEAVDQPVPTVHTGQSAASWAAGLLFGSTLITNTATPPTSGQCLSYNGTGITGAACSSTSSYPTGNSPQITGFSGVNASESESVVGDCTFSRSGANQYTTTCTKTSGVNFGTLATLGVGPGLVSAGGNLALGTPVSTTLGGTGVASPAAHDVMFAEGGAAFNLLSLPVDTVLQGTGATTDPQAAALTSCSTSSSAVTYNTTTHAFGCNALGAISTLGVGTGLTSSGGNLNLTTPVVTANGGTGIVSPTAHDILIAEGASAMTLLNLGVDTLLQGTATDPIAGALLSCSTASSALTYNTATHAFGCNTISGSGTVNSGTIGQFAVYTSTGTVVGSVGGVRNVCSFSGATADIQFANAIAALPNGGIIDARCYGFSTVTLAAEVLLPSNIPFSVLIDKATTFNTTINNAAKSAFHEQGQSTIQGNGVTGVAGGFGITLANGASVKAEIYMDGTGGGLGNSVENIGLNGNSAATVASGLLFAQSVGNIANLSGVQTTANGSPLMLNLLDVTGPMRVVNNYADCGSVAGTCVPLKIVNDNGGVGTNNVVVEGGVYAHEGAGGDCAEIDIPNLGGGNVTGLTIHGVTLESAHTCAIGILSTQCADCHFDTFGCSAAGANGTTCVKIANGGANNVTVEELKMYNSWTNTLVNTYVTPNVTITDAVTPDLGFYMYQGFSEPNGFRIDAGNNQSMVYDINGMAAHLLGFNIVYSAAGTAIPACAAALENRWACVSDSTACTSGTTYTSGGATKCLLECNAAGTAWKESGTNCF